MLRWASNIYTCIVVLTSRCCGVLFPALTGHNLIMQCCDVRHNDDHTSYYSLNAMYTSKAPLLDYLVTVKLAGGYSVSTENWYQLSHQDATIWQTCTGITSGFLLGHGLSRLRYQNSYVHTLDNILARLQEVANCVWDGQGKVTMIAKRFMDSSAQMDIKDKLAEALEIRSREGTVLEQIRQEAKNKAQELHITLTPEQLRTDV